MGEGVDEKGGVSNGISAAFPFRSGVYDDVVNDARAKFKNRKFEARKKMRDFPFVPFVWVGEKTGWRIATIILLRKRRRLHQEP